MLKSTIFLFILIIFYYDLLKIVFTIPSSIRFEKTLFNIINTIGPINSPISPIILKPVYIAINVNIGCIPIWPLIILGSVICLTTNINIYIANIVIASDISPLNAEIIAQGIMAVPAPKIGSASTKAMPKRTQ